MTLLVLTARPDIATNRRLADAASRMGLLCHVIDATRAIVMSESREPAILVGPVNYLDPRPAAVIARVGNWRPDTLLAALQTAEDAGVFTPNPAAAMRTARDHWRTVVRLSRGGLPVPRSMVGMDPELTARAAACHLGLPVVVKLRRSRMGVGVILCRTLDHLQSVLDSLWRLGDEFLVQEYIHVGGMTTRVLVVGGAVAAAARFKSVGAEWRSNSAQGGTAEAADLQIGEREVAVAAAATLELGTCAVDLLAGPDGPMVCELNPTPGFVRLEEATGVDAAAAIVRFAAAGRTAVPDNV